MLLSQPATTPTRVITNRKPTLDGDAEKRIDFVRLPESELIKVSRCGVTNLTMGAQVTIMHVSCKTVGERSLGIALWLADATRTSTNAEDFTRTDSASAASSSSSTATQVLLICSERSAEDRCNES